LPFVFSFCFLPNKTSLSLQSQNQNQNQNQSQRRVREHKSISTSFEKFKLEKRCTRVQSKCNLTLVHVFVYSKQKLQTRNTTRNKQICSSSLLCICPTLPNGMTMAYMSGSYIHISMCGSYIHICLGLIY